jgi:endonuclease YncB( thermonuclease family)
MNEQPLDDRLAYNAAEESARADRFGLWADRDPVAPWEWRKARRKK